MSQPPDTIYRYRPLGSSWVYRLAEFRGDVWLSVGSVLNDPFDGVSFADEEKRIAIATHDKSVRFENTYVWSIACFSERWDSPPMWAHYAHNHTGICIGYDTEKLLARYEEVKSQSDAQMREGVIANWRGGLFAPVEYVATMPADFATDEEAILTKLDPWAYEREWRLALKCLYGSISIKNNGYKVSFAGAVKEILCPELTGVPWVELKAIRDAFCPDVPIIRIKPSKDQRTYTRGSTA